MEKKISPEDRFQMASLQPTCHTKAFTNDYFFRVVTKFEGCVCCNKRLDARMKMTIVPIVNPACFGFKPGNDFNPTEVGSFSLNLRKGSLFLKSPNQP